MVQLAKLKELRTFFAGVPQEKINMNTVGIGFNPKGNNAEHSCLTAGCLWGWAQVYKPFNIDPIYTITNDNNGMRGLSGIDFIDRFGDYFDLPYDDSRWLTDPWSYEQEMRPFSQYDSDSYDPNWRTKIPKENILAHLDQVIAKYEGEVK